MSNTPQTFYLAGSNDGIVWSLIDTEILSSIPNNSSTAVVSYPASSNVNQFYTYFRLIIPNNFGGATVQLFDWQMYGGVSVFTVDSAGVTGEYGFTGLMSALGFTGWVGATGFTGITGWTGSTGFTGYTGTTGWTGPTGASGISGRTGTLGYWGQTGPWTGPTGIDGPLPKNSGNITTIIGPLFPLNMDSALVLYYPFNSDVFNYATGVGVSNATIVGTSVSISNSFYKIGNGSLRQTSSVPTNGYLSISTIPANTGGYTFSCWFYQTNNSTNGMLFAFDGSLGNSQHFYCYYNPPSIYFGIGNSYYTFMSPVLNTWYHIAWTLSTGNASVFYINGVQSGTTTGIPYLSTSFVSNTILATPPLSQNNFVGYIDDFRYYNRVLSAAEISSLYNYSGQGSIVITPYNILDTTGTFGYTGTYTGTTGATGATGVYGETGIWTGTTGATGLSGWSGFIGWSGLTGMSGETGCTGDTGMSGMTGITGRTGATARTGATGITGMSGVTGVTGPTGYIVTKTLYSMIGYTGSNLTGATGYTGATGWTGITGWSGWSGTTGAVGATGVIGVTGPVNYGSVISMDSTNTGNIQAMPVIGSTFTSNNLTVNNPFGGLMYYNGAYVVSGSSYNSIDANTNYFNAFTTNSWSCGISGESTNGVGFQYTRNPYDGSGNYVGGGAANVFYTTVVSGVGTICGEYLQFMLPTALNMNAYSIVSNNFYYVNAPTNLSLGSITVNSMVLSYTASATNGSGLTYYATTSPSTSTFTSSSTSMNLTGLSSGTSYTVSLYATISQGLTSSTATTSGTTSSVANISATGNYTVVTNYLDPSDNKTYTQYIYTSGNSNTFQISNNSQTTLYILAIAGGGGGGAGGNSGGGGGAGGFVQAGPIVISSSNETITINIGSGGISHTNGGNTTVSFLTNTGNNITCIGGGYGGNFGGSGNSGGSGGGKGRDTASSSFAAGTVGQGNNGGYTTGSAVWGPGAGGGGAGAVGGNGIGGGGPGLGTSGSGGSGKQYTLRGFSNSIYWAGGGGSGSDSIAAGNGGLGGGGGGSCRNSTSTIGTAGTGGGSAYNGNSGGNGVVGNGNTGGSGGTNTGGGGGGGVTGGTGGSGIVIITFSSQTQSTSLLYSDTLGVYKFASSSEYDASSNAVLNYAYNSTYYDLSAVNMSSTNFRSGGGIYLYQNNTANTVYIRQRLVLPTFSPFPTTFTMVFTYDLTAGCQYGRIFSMQNFTKNKALNFYWGPNWNSIFIAGTVNNAPDDTSGPSLNSSASTVDTFIISYNAGTFKTYSGSNTGGTTGTYSNYFSSGDNVTILLGCDPSYQQNLSTNYPGSSPGNSFYNSNNFLKSCRFYNYVFSSTEVTNAIAGTYPHAL